MNSKALQLAQELREQAEAYANFLRAMNWGDPVQGTAPGPGLSIQELPALAGYAENLAHVLRGIVASITEYVEVESDSPSACRAYERLMAVQGLMIGAALLIEHATGDLATYANFTPSQED